jgi:hypothetical protein
MSAPRIGTRVRVVATGEVGTVTDRLPAVSSSDTTTRVTFDTGNDAFGRPLTSIDWFRNDELEVVL